MRPGLTVSHRAKRLLVEDTRRRSFARAADGVAHHLHGGRVRQRHSTGSFRSRRSGMRFALGNEMLSTMTLSFARPNGRTRLFVRARLGVRLCATHTSSAPLGRSTNRSHRNGSTRGRASPRSPVASAPFGRSIDRPTARSHLAHLDAARPRVELLTHRLVLQPQRAALLEERARAVQRARAGAREAVELRCSEREQKMAVTS